MRYRKGTVKKFYEKRMFSGILPGNILFCTSLQFLKKDVRRGSAVICFYDKKPLTDIDFNNITLNSAQRIPYHSVYLVATVYRINRSVICNGAKHANPNDSEIC